MRDAIVNAQLNHFRVDHQQFYFIRGCFIKNADDQRVDADRFTGTGRTGNQGMRHFCQIGNGDIACNVAAQSHRQLGFRVAELVRVDDLADADGADYFVRHLNAHGRFVWDRRFDTNTGSCQIQSDVVSQAGDFTDFYAGRWLQFITSNRRTSCNVHNAGLYTEAAQGIYQLFSIDAKLFLQIRVGGLRHIIEQVNRRWSIWFFLRFHRFLQLRNHLCHFFIGSRRGFFLLFLRNFCRNFFCNRRLYQSQFWLLRFEVEAETSIFFINRSIQNGFRRRFFFCLNQIADDFFIGDLAHDFILLTESLTEGRIHFGQLRRLNSFINESLDDRIFFLFFFGVFRGLHRRRQEILDGIAAFRLLMAMKILVALLLGLLETDNARCYLFLFWLFRSFDSRLWFHGRLFFCLLRFFHQMIRKDRISHGNVDIKALFAGQERRLRSWIVLSVLHMSGIYFLDLLHRFLCITI